MDAKLRPARESEALDLACLVDTASRGLAAWSWSTMHQPGQSVIEVGRTRIRSNTASPLHYTAWTIAEVDGSVAGAFAGRLIPVPHEQGDVGDLAAVFAPVLELEAVAAGSWYLNVLAVHPEFRGRGLGGLLITRAEELALAADATQMSVMVEEVNAGAVRLYGRHGFGEWARRPFIPFPGSTDKGDWLLLRKQLQR